MDELTLFRTVKYLEKRRLNFLLLTSNLSLVLPELATSRYDSLDISPHENEHVYSLMQMPKFTYNVCMYCVNPLHLTKILRSITLSEREAVNLVTEVRSNINDDTTNLDDIYDRLACKHVNDMVAVNNVLEKFTVNIGYQLIDPGKLIANKKWLRNVFNVYIFTTI